MVAHHDLHDNNRAKIIAQREMMNLISKTNLKKWFLNTEYRFKMSKSTQLDIFGHFSIINLPSIIPQQYIESSKCHFSGVVSVNLVIFTVKWPLVIGKNFFSFPFIFTGRLLHSQGAFCGTLAGPDSGVRTFYRDSYWKVGTMFAWTSPESKPTRVPEMAPG